MENTIKNMGLILEEMKKGLQEDNTQSVKTLADTYLSQFSKLKNIIHDNDVKNVTMKHARKLYVHRELLEGIVKDCDNKMEEYLTKGRHKDSHRLAITLEKVYKVIRDINYYFPSPKIDIEKEFPVEPRIQELLDKSIETGTLVTFYNEEHKGGGKTTALIKKAYELDAVLLVGSETQSRLVNDLAKSMGLSITVASVVREISLVQIKRQLEARGYLLDEPVDLKSLPNLKKYKMLGGFMRIMI